jgi:hypothetical protein
MVNVMVFINNGNTFGVYPAGTHTVEFTATVTSYVGFSAASGTSGTFTLDDVTLIPLGVTLSPDAAQPGSGSAWYDTSGNGRTITLPNSGVSWSVATGGYNPQITTVNSSMGFLAQNKSTGNAAVAAIELQNEAGAAYGFGMRYFGGGFTQVNAYRANRGLLYGAFDLNFLSGQYKFWFGTTGAAIDNSTAYEGFNLYGPSISTGTATVLFTTPSSAFGTGALIVGGGASFGGAIFSQQNSNSIVTGTNFANTNAGTAATLRHTLTAGTNTSTIEAYSNGHATFPGRLRFGTPNGQMDFVPSGVLGMSISASAVTVPTSLTVSGAGSAGTIWNTTNQGAGNVQTLLTLRESHNVDAPWPNSAVRMLFAGRWNSVVDFEIADIRGFAGAGYQGGLVFGVHRSAPDTDPLVNAMFLSPAGNLVIGTTFSEVGLSGAGGLQVTSRVAQGTEGIATGADPVFAASVTNATTKDILYWGAASRGGLLRGYHDGGGAIRWQFGRYSGGTFEEYLRLTGTTAASSVLNLYGGTQSVDNISGTLVVSGGIGLGGNINMGGRLFINNTSAANDALSASGIIANFGADATLGSVSFGVKGYPSATGANRYVQITAADNAAYREVRINDLGGNVRIGASTSAITVSGTLTATGGIIDPPIIGTILEDIFTITDGAAFEVDPGNGSIQLITLGASRTPKATNFAAGESITLMVNDGTAYTLTWTDATWGTGGVVWVGGTAPTLATSGYTVIQFWKVGTQIYGARVGDVA